MRRSRPQAHAGARFHPCGSAECRSDFEEKAQVRAELVKANHVVRISPPGVYWRLRDLYAEF